MRRPFNYNVQKVILTHRFTDVVYLFLFMHFHKDSIGFATALFRRCPWCNFAQTVMSEMSEI